MRSFFVFSLVLLLGVSIVKSQDGVVDINSPLQAFLEKQHAAGLLQNMFLIHKPLSTAYAKEMLDSLASRKYILSQLDQEILERYLHAKRSYKPNIVKNIIPQLYPYGESLVELQTKDFRLQINPVIDFKVGFENRSGYGSKGARVTWQQTRGIRITGNVNKRFYFDTSYNGTLLKPYEGELALDPLATLPRYRAVERSWDSEVDRAEYDIPTSVGILGYSGKYVDIRLGRDVNRWTEGIGSIFLSDYAPVYDQLRVSTKIWKLEYVNLLTAFNNRFRSDDILHTRRKYGAFHSLSLNINTRLNLTFFESIIFSKDSLGMVKKQIDRPAFDPAFANPVILYQAVEEDLGDLGNATLGLGGYWRLRDGVKVYGQFLLDEFSVRDYLDVQKNAWTKKYALLTGIHFVKIPKSNVKLEYSKVRPFTYSHHSGQTNYIHFNDYLGHPLGSNFKDIMLWYHLGLSKSTNVYLTMSYTKRGRNTQINYGGSPLNPYTTRAKNEDVKMFDGILVKQFWNEFRINQEIAPKLFLEASLILSRVIDAERGVSVKMLPQFQLRWGQVYQSEKY